MMLALALFAALQVSPKPVDDDGIQRGRALDMTQVEIRGALVQPSVGWLKTGPKAHKRNLIEMRTNFRPELAKTRDALATAP
jgi:hypothetical protein